MKNSRFLFYVFLSLMSVSILTSCSFETNNKEYKPQIFDKTNNLSDSITDLFLSYSFPKGLVPVMVCEKSISEEIYTSSIPDIVFDELSERKDLLDFEDYGLLVYISESHPTLVQIRLGKEYSDYASYAGITQGVNYIRMQEQYVDGDHYGALIYLLDSVNDNITKYKSLSKNKKGILKNISISLNRFLDWSGSPSKSYFKNLILTPHYYILAFGNHFFNSWLIGLVLLLITLWIIKVIVVKLFIVIIPNFAFNPIVMELVKLFLNIFIIIVPSGCVMLLSSCRMEDVISIKALNIPYFDVLTLSPELLSHNVSPFFSITSTVLFVWYLKNCNDIFILTLLPKKEQEKNWETLNESNKLLLDTFHPHYVLEGETNYIAMHRERSTQLMFFVPFIYICPFLLHQSAIFYVFLIYALWGILLHLPKFIGAFLLCKDASDSGWGIGRIIWSIFHELGLVAFIYILFVYVL